MHAYPEQDKIFEEKNHLALSIQSNTICERRKDRDLGQDIQSVFT
jgi:hypothetical protein